MKAIVIVSALTFVVLLGAILAMSGMLEQVVGDRLARIAAGERPDEGEATALVLADLDRERQRLLDQRDALAARATEYEAREKAFGDEIARLEGIIADLEKAQDGHDAAQEAEIVKLARVYEAMKPQSAASILTALDVDVVLGIMRHLGNRQAARILAFMSPAQAAAISARLSPQGGDS